MMDFIRVGLPGASQMALAMFSTFAAMVDAEHRSWWIILALVGAGGVYMATLAACELGRRKAERWMARRTGGLK